MEHEKHQHDNGFILGFMLGLLAMFLLGTKKGRELLNNVTKEGSEKFADLKNTFEEDLMDDEREDETDFIPVRTIGEHIHHEKYPTHGRRFFKRHKKD